MKIRSNEYLQISDVSESLGITPRAIRLYEKLGIIDSPQRTRGRIRLYDKNDLVRIKFVLRLKVLGLSLEEIRELVRIYNENKDLKMVISRVNLILEDHLLEIRQKKTSLCVLEAEIDAFRKNIYGQFPSEGQMCTFPLQLLEN